MSGGGGGPVIIGDKSVVDQIEANLDRVAEFRRNRAEALIKLYRNNETAITGDDQQFLFRCLGDIVDNA